MIRPRRLLALTLLAVAAFAPIGPSASAAPGGAVANLSLRDFTVPADGPAVEDELFVFLSSGKAGWADELTISVDTSELAGVAELAVEPVNDGVECSTAGTVARCTVPGPHEVIVVPQDGEFAVVMSPTVAIGLTAASGAATGDAGTLTVTARADDGPVTTETSTVRIGEGVNLTAVDEPSRSVRAGTSATLRPQVRAGGRDVEGVTLTVSGEALVKTNFGNCAYGAVIACAFDTTLAAGRTYRTSAPFTVRVPRDAATGSETGTGVEWLTDADWRDMSDDLPTGRQGTGPDLRLEEVAVRAAARAPQTDVDGDDNGTFTEVVVTGGRRPDIVAVGATVSASPGQTRTVEVGMVNRGPGTLHHPPFSNNLPAISVTLPPGVSVVRADDDCFSPFDGSDDDGPAGPPPSAAAASGATPAEYFCMPDPVRARPGQRILFAFTVKVTAAARHGRGSVDVSMTGERALDRNTRNNSAPIRVSLGAGGGGGLPVTGSTAATVAGAGLLLVLAGAVVTAGLRRRS